MTVTICQHTAINCRLWVVSMDLVDCLPFGVPQSSRFGATLWIRGGEGGGGAVAHHQKLAVVRVVLGELVHMTCCLTPPLHVPSALDQDR